MRKISLLVLFTTLLAGIVAYSQAVKPPLPADSLRFAVIGDSGTGAKSQYEVANQLTAARTNFPFEFVLMLGDNLYGTELPADFKNKFERPYKALLASGVRFFAALGNHDEPPRQINYKLFNMDGKRYYSFKAKAGIRFFALDSNYMDKEELDWFDKELKASGSEWKVVFFHHPIYSSGERHGSNMELRSLIEPVMVDNGVDVVLSGHEHFYERIKPQKGINYFIVGSSAKIRESNIAKTELTAKGFDQDNVFMLAEISGDDMRFQIVTRAGQTVDSGVVRRAERKPKAAGAK